MHHVFNLSFLLFVFGQVDGSVSPNSYVYVNTSRGSLFGFHVDYGSDKSQLYYGQGDIFLGIPYVLPPFGERRFKRPERLQTFNNNQTSYNATYYRPACPQKFIFATPTNISEDCLYLNIFTPNAKSVYKYPVMIWIHGGFFLEGSALDYQYKGAIRNLVSRGVVVVTIQYRLGMLGFFTTFTEDFPPNNAMLDQVEAIKFVQEEIANFGGDPYRITLFGESAGSNSVVAHTYSPLSQNRFQQGIMQSCGMVIDGVFGYQNLSFIKANELCNTSLKEWESKNYTKLSKCLNTMDYTNWLSDSIDQQWTIVVDGHFLPDYPINLYKKRPNIPIIIGHNRDETALYELFYLAIDENKLTDFTRDYVTSSINSSLGYMPSGDINQALKIIESVFFPVNVKDDDHLAWLKTKVRFTTSTTFVKFNAKEVEHQLMNGNDRVYAYEFAYSPKFMDSGINGWNPVPHALEIEFLWMDAIRWEGYQKNNTLTKQDIEIADFFGRTWTNLAKFQSPQAKNWKPATLDDVKFLEIGKTRQSKANYVQVDNIIWNKVFEAMSIYSNTSYSYV